MYRSRARATLIAFVRRDEQDPELPRLFDAAAADLDAATRIDPANATLFTVAARARNLYADTRMAQDLEFHSIVDEAVRLARRATPIDPSYPEAWEQLGNAWAIQLDDAIDNGRDGVMFAEAKTAYQRLLAAGAPASAGATWTNFCWPTHCQATLSLICFEQQLC